MKRKRKWSPAQHVRFKRTMEIKKNGRKRIKQSSHFYRLSGTELIPVKVKKIVAWVIE